MTHDMWNVTHDMWHVTRGGGEHSLKMSSPYLLRFGKDSVLRIGKKRIIDWLPEWMNELVMKVFVEPSLLKSYMNIEKQWVSNGVYMKVKIRWNIYSSLQNILDQHKICNKDMLSANINKHYTSFEKSGCRIQLNL